MSTRFNIRKLLLGAPLLAVAAAWALLPARTEAAAAEDASETTELVGDDADALAAVVSNCTYYNNANHTQVVGQFGYDCCNNPVSWGRKSSFKVCGGCFICFPPPPQ